MQNIKPYIDGWVAGSIGLILTHPLDTIKTLMQNRQYIRYSVGNLYRGLVPPLIGAGFSRSALFGTYSLSRNYFSDNLLSIEISGMIAGVANAIVANPFQRYKIARQTNNIPTIKSITQGLHVSILRDSIAFLIYFSFYERSKKYLFPYSGVVGIKSAVLGGFAGALTWIFIYPIDTIKTQVQANGGTIREKIINIKNNKTNIYSGFPYAIYRAVPLHAITFFVLEWMKSIQ